VTAGQPGRGVRPGAQTRTRAGPTPWRQTRRAGPAGAALDFENQTIASLDDDMSKPTLLHIFAPTKNVSPFDINMAYEAEFDDVIPYSNVTLEEITDLTQDTIFSRGPEGVKRTAIFIGGREFELAVNMLDTARAAMVPPFQVSVVVDPSGAITTSAALVASVEHQLIASTGRGLEGRRTLVFGGTGPVGVCTGVLFAHAGASTRLVSHLNLDHAQQCAAQASRRFEVRLDGADGSTDDAKAALLADAEVVVATAKAGICVLSARDLWHAKQVEVLADVNAVPPAGIEGVGVNDFGKPVSVDGREVPGIGALGVGNVKYKVHTRMLEMARAGKGPHFLAHREALDIAREVLAEDG